MTPTTRLSAEERRDEVIAAATIEFALSGYAGTPTEAVARRAGVSQPYLFQLFGTKKDLFVAALNGGFARTGRTFETAGRQASDKGLSPAGILEEMGHAYISLLMTEPNVLRLQLQGYAACVDPDIRAAVRRNYAALWDLVGRVSGADEASVRDWFAMGMLINVVASVGEGLTFEDYLQSLRGGATTCK
jgi:AcrR family transcriptional regulator